MFENVWCNKVILKKDGNFFQILWPSQNIVNLEFPCKLHDKNVKKGDSLKINNLYITEESCKNS